MRLLPLFTALALVAGGLACDSSPLVPAPPAPPDKPPPAPIEPAPDGVPAAARRLVDLHNSERAKHGAPALRLHYQVQAAAQKHADFMARNERLSHTGGGGSTVWDRLRLEGYRGTSAGENIAMGYDTPEAVFKGWMSSPGHRANLLTRTWTHVGVGVADTGGTRLSRRYWCVVFAAGGSSAAVRRATDENIDVPETLLQPRGLYYPEGVEEDNTKESDKS